MRFSTELYYFDLPGKWDGIVGVKKRGRTADIVLLWEKGTGHSGLLASLRCLKRKASKRDDDKELLGTLTDCDGGTFYLYAAYGREGSVSEENEDLYWRLRDRLWQIFESIRPAGGCIFSVPENGDKTAR